MNNLSVENLNINLEGGASVDRTPVVFIPNKSGHNFSDCLRYGTPQFVTSGEVNRFSVGFMSRKWMASLFDSSPKDYILLTSLTILTVVGAAIFGWLHGSINILLFRNNRYILRSVNFRDLYNATKEQREDANNETS